MKRKTIEEAAIAYVAAYNTRKAAKQALRNWFNDNSDGGESYPCVNGVDHACFKQAHRDEYCEYCVERRRLYEAYYVTIAKQQARLKTLDRAVNRTEGIHT